jgi:hypothetical protein
MSIGRVSGLAHDVEAGVITWGERLATLERGDDSDRTVVAAVRFSGVDQPTFQEAESTDLDLNAVAPIDVELSTTGALVMFARETALSGLDALTNLTAAVERSDESQRLAGTDTSATAFLRRMDISLGSHIDFDVNEDWISVADVLEYEIADLLPHWSALMRDAGDGRPHTIGLSAGSMS